MNRKIMLVSTLAVVVSLFAVRCMVTPDPVRADDKSPIAAANVPVETDMHNFMEAVFQGPYRRLKTAITTEPTGGPGWKAIRSEALILAEGGNLLLVRKPEKDADKWTEFSVGVRDHGAELYNSAKKKDFAGSRKAYESMIKQCNACHKHFDEGKNQLVP